ncbi:MAG: type II toxin-antitoxin system RelE/ParE family toxin [bacterium]|nr:type II toxin-antitoxin system RelE/ParE family toxin [bacterium]
MNFEIRYHEDVLREDMPKISKDWQNSIKRAIEEKLTHQPEVFGRPLRHSLKGYRKLRVGDYRVVFRIESSIVKILLIQHRSVAYKSVLKRI